MKKVSFDAQKIESILDNYHDIFQRNISREIMEDSGVLMIELEEYYHNYHKTRFLSMIKNIIDSGIKFENFVDLGSYFGHFCHLISTFFDVKGIAVDIDVPYNREAEKVLAGPKISCLYSNFIKDKLPIEDNNNDLVILSEVIEHLPSSPVPILKEINRILKPGGYIYLTTPNALKLTFRLDTLKGKNPIPMFDDIISLETAQTWHWREYVPGECKILLERTGFDVIKTDYSIYYPPTIKNPVKSFLYNILTNYKPLKDSFWIIGKKKN